MALGTLNENVDSWSYATPILLEAYRSKYSVLDLVWLSFPGLPMPLPVLVIQVTSSEI